MPISNRSYVVRIECAYQHRAIAKAIRSRLRDRGVNATITVVSVSPSASGETTLRIPPGGLPHSIGPALSVLAPLIARREVSAELIPGQLCLRVEGPADALEVAVRLRCPHQPTGEAVTRSLKDAGFPKVRAVSEVHPVGDTLHHRGNGFAAAAAAFVLAGYNVAPTMTLAQGPPGGPITIDLLTPALGPLGGKIDLSCDDPEALPVAAAAFRENGMDVEPRLAPPGSLDRFEVDPGVLGRIGGEGAVARMMMAAEAAIPPRSKTSFPLERAEERGRGNPSARLPIAALRDGTLLPYAGDEPQRFKVDLYRDDKRAGQRLKDELTERGFRVRSCAMPDRVARGFEVRRGGDSMRSLRLRELIREAMEVVMLETGTLDNVISFMPGASSDTIEIVAPFAAAADGSLDNELNDPGSYEVTIRAEAPEAAFAERVLGEAGFRQIHVDLRPADGDYLLFDTAKLGFVKSLRDRLSALDDAPRLELSRMPTDGHRQIIICMTQRSTLRMHGKPNSRRPWSGHGGSERDGLPVPGDGILHDAIATDLPTFLEQMGDRVRIGEHVMPVRTGAGERVPSLPDAFTVDLETARALAFLAEADLRKRSALLVGETGTSKTASVQVFAHLTGRPLYAISFSESAQVEDLLGQISPTGAWWEWSDGAVTRALREGAVLLLDEVNLAPSAILARLHELHEKRPALSLQERGTERVAAAEGFFMAATCNPAGYEGRQALSPDLIERFTGLATGLPDAQANLAFLRRVVHGRQPAIRVGGRNYRGAGADPVYPELAEVRAIDVLLERLASFHAEVQAAGAAARQQGRTSWWTPVGAAAFSRRRLIRVVEDLAALVAAGVEPEAAAATAVRERYALLLTPEARAIVADIAAANGLDMD